MKKDGGTIDNWQLHTLSLKQEIIDKVYPNTNATSQVFTGTVVESDLSKYQNGFHMRSSLIIKIDRENGIIETLNTIYKVLNEGNDDVTLNMGKILGIDSPDIGEAVMGLFY
jgi:hypothetical protein